MISKPIENPVVAISVKVYRALLVAYPARFQQEYGPHMLQVFRDCCLRTFRQGGTNGMARLWAVTLFDLIPSVVSEHAHKEIEMKKEIKPRDIRLSGWSFIIGAIAFLPGAIGMLSWEGESSGSTPMIMQLVAFAVFLAPLLMVLGMLGLRARYKIGGGFLLFGAIVGGLLVVVGILVQFLTPDYSVSETYYGVWLGGVAILNVCLILFGFVALFEKPLPRWNWLPLAAGSWIVLLPILAGITGFQSSPVIIAVLVIMTILQVLLGYILQAGTSQELTPA